MSNPLTIVVTGANRGIGLGIIRLLAKTHHERPLSIYATSRAGTDLQVPTTNSNSIQYRKLDIGDHSSIVTFLAALSKDNANVDVLINNAGINNNNRETTDLAEQVINVNYRGTRAMCEMFLSDGKMAQRKGARIVNVSSTASQLSNYTTSLQDSFRVVSSLDDVDELASSYISAVREGPEAQKSGGWGSGPRSYQVSKALMNALTVVLAKQNENVLINCCCPGWVDTDMGHQVGKPPKALEEGARIPVRLAIGELGGKGDADGGLGKGTERVSGRYFGNDGVTDRGWGKAREW